MGQKRNPDNSLTLLDTLDLETVESIINSTPQGETYPEEVVDYLNHLEIVRTQIMRYKDRSFIIKLLMAPPHNLSRFKAQKRFVDAMEFFYVDKDIKGQAWANVMADKVEQTANALRPLIRDFKDAKVWADMMEKVVNWRLKYRKDDNLLPEEKKPVRIYTSDVGLMGDGLIMEDRQKLKAYIQQMDVPEKDRKRIMAEAGVDPPNLNLEHDSPGD